MFLLLLFANVNEARSQPGSASPVSDFNDAGPLVPSLMGLFPDQAPAVVRSEGAIHIVAVLAEFEREDNRFTTGDGGFDLDILKRDDIVIDPLPHDQSYFEAHLEFVRNYYHRVSGGKLDISYTVLSQSITLPHPMSHYAPLGEDNAENHKLAWLARDAWERVEISNHEHLATLDPNRTLFVVFHAGSGRNIELMGTSLFKTPQDIPSVYLGQSSLGRLLDQPGFDGFDIGIPSLPVTNTAILPQTQSRAGEDVTGREYVLQLSINGLLAANVGSFIGLPDLFNTRTGTSGIGRFGLMDGAAIFSYLGLFPPEPSAWEKIYLGWKEPFTLRPHSGARVELPAASLRKDSSIVRIPLSADEYFLVENRHRNVDDQPLQITIRTPDGRLITREIAPDDTRFDPLNSEHYNELLEPGVVVDVSHFDWSLPGGPDPATVDEQGRMRILNGGILIWHIDETVIRQKLPDNEINANRNHPGVVLVEADGAQDIGRPTASIGDRYVNGHAFDFWWKGNDFTVITASGREIVLYENRFGPDTRPSNHSHSGSPSFFELYDFSDALPVAHFHTRPVPGRYTIPTEPAFPNISVPPSLLPLSHLWPASMQLAGHTEPDQQDASNPLSSFYLLVPTLQGLLTAPADRSENIWTLLQHARPSAPLVTRARITAGQWPTPGSDATQTVRSFVYENGQWQPDWERSGLEHAPGLPSLLHPDLVHLEHTPVQLQLSDGADAHNQGEAPFQRSSAIDGISAEISHGEVRLTDNSFSHQLDNSDLNAQRQYVGHIGFHAGSDPAFFLLTDTHLALIDTPASDHSRRELRTLVRGPVLSWPALTDFTGDQALDILVSEHQGPYLHGFSRDGALLDFFPLKAPRGLLFTGTPLAADITSDGQQELLVAARDSTNMLILAYDRQARLIEGFPLLVGSLGSPDTQTHFGQTPELLIAREHLFAIAPAGDVRAWHLPDLGRVTWPGVYGPDTGNKVGYNQTLQRERHTQPVLLHKAETYNWPNPATDHTHIRFETFEPARIDITIVNSAGSTMFETSTDSGGRHPQEVRIATTGWGSGVYFASVRAHEGGRSESSLLKIVISR